MSKRKYPAGEAIAIKAKHFQAYQLNIAVAVLTPAKIKKLEDYIMRNHWRKLPFHALQGDAAVDLEKTNLNEICIHWGDHTPGREKGNWVYFTYTIKKIDDLCVVFKFKRVEVE